MDEQRRTPIPVARALRQVGEDLTYWRKLQRLTVAEVAGRADVGVRTVRRLEDGEGANLENFFRVARALGVLDTITDALDPSASDLGRLRSEQSLPQRIRRSADRSE